MQPTTPARRRLAVLSLAAGALCVLGSGLAQAQTPAYRAEYRLSTTLGTAFPWGQAGERWIELVKEKTQGRINIKLYSGNSLVGGDQTREFTAIRQGVIDMSIGSTINWSPQIKELNLFSLPFLMPDYKAMDALTQGEVGRDLFAVLEKRDVIPLAWGENGFRELSNSKRPVATPADLKGMKIRVPQTEASIEGFKALGAAPTPMAFSEVYMALQQKVVDGQENPLSVIVSAKFNEVQKYLSLTNHQLFIQVLSISEKTWKKLSPEHQKILMEAAKEAQAYEREIAAKEETELIKTLKDKGMTLNEVKDVTPFAEAAKPLRDIYIKKLGKDAQDMFGKIDSVRNK